MHLTDAKWLIYAGLAEATIANLKQALNEAVTTLGVVQSGIEPDTGSVDYRTLIAYMKPAIENGRKVLNEEN